MTKPRNKKVLGIVLGERSLLVAEVVSGDRPLVTRTAEMTYPEGTSAGTASAGVQTAFASFLKLENFTARSAIVGLPARWLVTQPREVPAADERTIIDLLRLSAEAQFSTELKDLVYDYTGSGTSVLLVATPKRYVDAAVTLCESAKVSVISVTSTALALGQATGRAVAKEVLVLSIAGGGGEMTLQKSAFAGALRHLRSPEPAAPFINELRRTVSTMPASNGNRELILWNATEMDAKSLADQIGVQVRSADLPMLGVSTTGSNGSLGNGQSGNRGSGEFAAAIALALEGIAEDSTTVDFLHSRLAPPKPTRVPRWAMAVAASLVLLVALTIYAFHGLHVQEAALDATQARYDGMKSRLDDANAFVSKVSFAQAWHGGDPRYLACIRDMTLAISEDFDTFAVGLIIGDAAHPPNSKTPDTHALAGVLQGKAADPQHPLSLLTRMKKFPGFVDVTPGGSDVGRGHEVTFQINFRYQAKAAQ